MNATPTVQPASLPSIPDCAKPVYRWTEDSKILRDCDKSVARMTNGKATITS